MIPPHLKYQCWALPIGKGWFSGEGTGHTLTAVPGRTGRVHGEGAGLNPPGIGPPPFAFFSQYQESLDWQVSVRNRAASWNLLFLGHLLRRVLGGQKQGCDDDP